MNLFKELKRRNVFKVAAAYIVVGWLIMQVAEVLVPALRLPGWVLTATLYFLMVGFLPALVFAWAFELTPEGLKKEKDVERGESIAHVTGRKLDFLIIGVLAIAVIYLVFDKFGPEPEGTEPFSHSPTSVATETEKGSDPVDTEAAQKSIAVLPFTNMSGDAENEYFSDGISEEILNALARVNELKVAGRTSSFAFKGRNEDLRLIGETLGVNHILEGSVRKADNTVRITAQLIQVSDGFHLWSETYDRELDNIFAIQDEIATAILSELKTQLVSGEQIASAQTDPRAYEKYLQAKQLMYTRQTDKLEQARQLLDEAITMDESFAPAWAQRAILSSLQSDQQYGTVPFADALAQTQRYAEHALELDPGLAEGWAARGLYLSNRPGSAENARSTEALERALEINPGLLDASNWLTSVLNQEHRSDEALRVREEMFERDPLYPPNIGNLTVAYMVRNRLGDYQALLDRVRPFMGEQPLFLMADSVLHRHRGDLSGALQIAKEAHALAPNNDFVTGALSRVYFFINDMEQAAQLSWGTNPFQVLALHLLGRSEEAGIVARQTYNAIGQPLALFVFMIEQARYQDLLDFVQQQYGGIREFHAGQDIIFGFGNFEMMLLALAAREAGQDASFELAMQLLREDLDQQRRQGADWDVFNICEIHYWTLAGDHDRAIELLDRAVDQGMFTTPRMSDTWRVLEFLEGDPRFEAIQARMLATLNRERVEAGYEPVEAAYSL